MLRIISVLLILRAAVAANAVEPQATESDELLFDAQLNSVTFVDQHLGWAVGDRGVIWHTADGGQAWKRQHSPVRCRLESENVVRNRDSRSLGLRRHRCSSEVSYRRFLAREIFLPRPVAGSC